MPVKGFDLRLCALSQVSQERQRRASYVSITSTLLRFILFGLNCGKTLRVYFKRMKTTIVMRNLSSAEAHISKVADARFQRERRSS